MCLHRISLLLVSLHLQSPVHFVVILDHGQLLLLIILADVCLRNVFIVDNVVNLILIAWLDLDTDDEVEQIGTIVHTRVEESALDEKRQELN